MTFSILISSYNISEYLEKCLESVLKQTYEDWEIILADDGSTDGSVDIIKKYAMQDTRIKAFYQNQNHGIASIRNLMLKESMGDYIIFLDGDDWWKNEKSLERIAEAIRENSIDIVVFQYEVVRKDGSSEYRSNNTQFLDTSSIYTGEEYLKRVLSKNHTYMWFPWLYAFRKDLWVETGIRFNPKSYALEDAEVIYRVILRASKIVIINEAVYQYQEERGGKLTQPSQKLLLSMLKFAVNNIDEVERMVIDREVKLLLKDNFSHSYYGVLFSVNYLNKSEMEEIFNLLDKNKSIMSYTRTPKYVFLSKIIRILGLHITSRLWFVFSKWKSGIC